MQNHNLSKTPKLILSLLILSLYPLSLHARSYVLILSQDDLKDIATSDDDSSLHDSSDWDEFGDSESKPDDELDPGTWRPIFEPDSTFPTATTNTNPDSTYYSGVLKMLSAITGGERRLMEEAAAEIEAAAAEGNPHAQSVLGFLYGIGMMQERNKGKAFLHHHFAAEGGNTQSKMALAYTYLRQEVTKP